MYVCDVFNLKIINVMCEMCYIYCRNAECVVCSILEYDFSEATENIHIKLYKSHNLLAAVR